MKALCRKLVFAVVILSFFACSFVYAGNDGLCLNFSLNGGSGNDLAEDYRAEMLGYSYAASKSITGEGVTIAVIDSGLWTGFTDHTSATIKEGINYLVEADSDDRRNTEDTFGHGTFVTSIICGDDVGLAPNVTIIPLKCFDNEYSAPDHVAEAIIDAVDTFHCDIINLSLGDTVEYTDLNSAVQHAVDSGVIVIASSGNTNLAGSSGNDPFRFPSSQNGVISVGAVDGSKRVWYRSVQNSAVTIVAPGVDACGLSIASGNFITNDGTSFAAPVVTATAALAISADASMTSDRFMSLLAATAEDLGNPGKDNSYGYGLINPALLLANILEDSDSLIVTGYDDKTCISSYNPEQTVSIIGSYEASGRCTDVVISEKPISNYVLPEGVDMVRIFNVLPDSFTPVNKSRLFLAH